MTTRHREAHKSTRVGWLRAAVLGANDGVISVSSLVAGVAASGVPLDDVLLTGVAGLVAGAMSMAAGEYVSVSSQADTEQADLDLETRELASEPERELLELTAIYTSRGLDAGLARQVAEQLTSRNALEAHARDELGITDKMRARPIQAAFASAASFVAGALVPVVATAIAPPAWVIHACVSAALVALCILGTTAAHAGGASRIKGAVRVVFWGAFAMALTMVVGRLFGASV